MRQKLVIAAVAIAAAWISDPVDAAPPAREVLTAVTLQETLLRIAAEMLGNSGLKLDEERAQVGTSHPLLPDTEFEVVALWRAGTGEPKQPFVFALAPISSPHAPTLRAYLSVPLMRDVLVARHKAPRGSVLRCDQLVLERKPLRVVPTHALAAPCTLDGSLTLKRALLAGEPLRASDLGPLPAVMAQGEVTVRVVVGQVALQTSGIALADADIDETVRVRLSGVGRTVDTRVVADRVVLLEETK